MIVVGLGSALVVGACAADPEGDSSTDGSYDPLHGADGKADSASTPTSVPYRGGPVLHHPESVSLYWGAYWATSAGAARRELLDGFTAGVPGTTWWDVTAEYTDAHGAPSDDRLVGPSAVVTTSEPGAVVSDARIRTFVTNQITSGAVPWSADAVYFVITPPGTVVSSRWGKSCGTLCAYHHYIHATIGGHARDVKYGVIPSLNCWSGCGGGSLHVNDQTTDMMTLAFSHELAEAATDPDENAWSGPHGNGEIGDLCDAGFAASWSTGRYAVQQLWSNVDDACVDRP